MKPKFLFNQGHCSFDEIHVRISSSAAMQFYKITKTLYFLELKKTIYNYCLSARYMISCNIYNTPSIIMKVKVLVPQSCPTLCNPMDCSPSGSSIHGNLQAGILEWVAISFSRGSSPLRDQASVSCIAGRFFTF